MARVMIVDDEDVLLQLYTEMIKLFGHEIVAAVQNGDEAIQAYREIENKPDLIILDHRMPIRNGLETATELLSQNPDEKIIFISADSSVKNQVMEMGVIEFLEKPFVLNKLKETITKVLEK